MFMLKNPDDARWVDDSVAATHDHLMPQLSNVDEMIGQIRSVIGERNVRNLIVFDQLYRLEYALGMFKTELSQLAIDVDTGEST